MNFGGGLASLRQYGLIRVHETGETSAQVAMVVWRVARSKLHDAIFENINTRLERRFCTSIQSSTPLRGILVLDKAPSPNPEAPARIVFQDRGELAEFQKGRSGRDIGPNPNAAGQQPSGRHLW